MGVHFDEPFLTLHWHDDPGIVFAEWRGAPPSDSLRRGLDAGLQLITQKNARKWLADTKNLGPTDPFDVKWVNDEWIPRAVAAGMRYMASVTPKKVIVQLTMKSFISRINDKELSNAYFENLDEARAWLFAQR